MKRIFCLWKGHRWEWWMVGYHRIGEPYCSRCFANWNQSQKSARGVGGMRYLLAALAALILAAPASAAIIPLVTVSPQGVQVNHNWSGGVTASVWHRASGGSVKVWYDSGKRSIKMECFGPTARILGWVGLGHWTFSECYSGWSHPYTIERWLQGPIILFWPVFPWQHEWVKVGAWDR